MCSEYKFTSRRIYSSCRDLPHLSAQLHWTYNSSTGIAQIAYHARQGPRGWVAWAVNPNQIGMVGSEALVAFHNSNGSMTVYTTLINNYSPSMVPGNLSFQVSGLSAESSINEITIFADVGPFSGGSVVNQVWQSGNLVLNDVPQMHAISQQNLQSTGEIDFLYDEEKHR
ncbi:cytochrome b561 and DOMON domain-containing protein At5g47530 [Lactuca sativa]|uniref:cytochrome b561 and DOMON domain-containing protein At5g47530 n=1 Tax=Lactuca sativa TaxID=4236 RepID=UPI000CC06F7C|nr:cytochrome b561 and DOMON domain-containing protein At5g47530 [Lactuca sativa]